jgi:hypothetical protein
MDIEKVLKNLITANFVMLGIIIAMGLAGYTTLPTALEEYSLALIDEYAFGYILVLPFLVAYITALILIYKLKPVGRTLFLWISIISVFMYFFTGPMITDELTSILGDASLLFDGVILGIIYFSPLKDKFSK